MKRLAALLLPLVTASGVAHGVVTQDCGLATSDCTIADTARQAHVYVGAAASVTQSPAELALLATHFNAMTVENEMKWGFVEPTLGAYDFGPADALADFAAANHLRLRGHALFWGRLQLPAGLASEVGGAADPVGRLRDLMRGRVDSMLGRYGDRVALWDVVNEPLDVVTGDFDQNLFFRTLGPGWVAEAFTLARAVDPAAELVLNEFSLGYPSPKLDALVQLVTDLRAAGVPVDGIGLQAHFFPFLPLPNRDVFEGSLRTLAALGVRVELTEVDVSLWHFRNDPDPLASQAAFYGDVVAACMAVPECRAVTMWGLHDGDTWLDGFAPFDQAAPNAPLLFDATLRPKPAYVAVRDAVRARAVSFVEQATQLRGALLEARRARALTGPSARVAARWLRRARRRLARGRFADGCEQLALAADALGQSGEAAATQLGNRLATLRDDLRCDAP